MTNQAPVEFDAEMTVSNPPPSDPRQDALKRFVAVTSEGKSEADFQDVLAADGEFGREIERLSTIVKEASGLRQLYADEIETLKRRGAKRRTLRKAGGATLLLVLTVSAAFTAFGWRKVESLSQKPVEYVFWDDSRVSLDAGGMLEVPLAPWRREARLLSGDAVFDIVHDSERPFAVQTVVASLTDLGTRFLVRADREKLDVAVFEGKVDIGSMTGHHMILAPGQAASAGSQGIANLAMPDEGEATAWRQGRLIFRDASLDQVTDRLSRYHSVPIVLSVPGLANLKVSGSFRIDDIEGALRTLEAALPVRISRAGGRDVIEPSRLRR